MSDDHNVFAGAYIDRAAEHRADARWQASALDDDATRFLLVRNGGCLANQDDGRLVLRRKRDLTFNVIPGQAIFLGLIDTSPVFALNAGTAPDVEDNHGEFLDLRSLGLLLGPRDANMAAHACAMVRWHEIQSFCICCGGATEIEAAGHASLCANPECGFRAFPRVDPAIIVLVTNGDCCLLGRQSSWPKGLYSTIAGFVEPGESLEDAVAREVYEETNIRVGEVYYQSSQPWPFPSSLMLGFRAAAESDEIRMNDGELEDVRWFTHAQLQTGKTRLPAPLSIARRLIDGWITESGD